MLLWLVVLLCWLLPGSLEGQALRVEGDLDHPAAHVLREILGRNRYLLITRDTVLPSTFHTADDLVVFGAEVRFQGTVEGSVAVIEGALFVRPRATIGGRIVAVRGEVYRSGLATMGEVIELPPLAEARTEGGSEQATVILLAPPRPPLVAFTGGFGVGLPTYDRVNGLTVRWGAAANLARDTVGPTLGGEVTYHSARQALGGTLGLDLPLSRDLWIRAEAGRRTATNERWIRGDFVNTLGAAALRSDPRNYFLTDEVSLGIQRRSRQPMISGEGRFLPRVLVRASRDRSVASADPWTLLGDEPWRDNPAIDPGTLVSIVGGGSAEWEGQTTSFIGDIALEWAPPGIGDFAFAQAVATGQMNVQALWGHTLDLFVHSRQTLGTGPAPRQRWSIVGGSSTIPTLEVGQFTGDRVVFFNSGYSVPLTLLSVPLLGPPMLRFEHALGAAWASDSPQPLWEQNLGAGFAFRFVRAVLFVNPADGFGDPTLSVSVSPRF